MDSTRIDLLIARVRLAKVFEFVELAGRLALRMECDGGSQISFVSPEERAAIETAVAAPPRNFMLGAARIEYDEVRGFYRGRDSVAGDTVTSGSEGPIAITVELVFVDPPEDPPQSSTIAHWAERYAWLRCNARRICNEAAARLDCLAETWSTTPTAIRAALALDGVTFYGTGDLSCSLAGGEPFADHSVIVDIDAVGDVVDVTLAG
jgi:hypothetical protein